jgi:hypothetical protein
MKSVTGPFIVLSVVAACASGPRTTPATDPAVPSESAALQVLEVTRYERGPDEGSVRVRLVNTSAGLLIGAVDVRSDPGMWLAPPRQQLELVGLSPGVERTVTLDYGFARISPEGTVRVRVGVAEEHADGWVYIPEPVAVRRFDAGQSAAARAFLDRFDRYATPELEVFAAKGIFSADSLAELASDRTRAMRDLARMLGIAPPAPIRFVFYADAASKTADTNTVGNGYARENMIIEVFNDSVRLDPYHELAHLVSGQLGWAPAWLNEGFAMYASEQLGADALEHQGSAGKTVDQATCGFRRAGALLPLVELLRLPDIGPEESRPNVTYAQAASFVGLLVHRFGYPALREAFGSLSPMASFETNDAAFARAFGITVQQADELWLSHLNAVCH